MRKGIIKTFGLGILLTLLCAGSIFTVYANEPSPWAKDILNKANQENIYQEFDNFQRGISRVEFCRLIRLFINREVEDEYIVEIILNTGYPFIDTDNNNVSLCYGAGIVSGTGGSMFSPSAMLTREQAAVIVMKAMLFAEKYQGTNMIVKTPPKELPFADKALVSPWAKDAVSIAYQCGVLKGDGVNFNPLDVVTREQAIILVYQSFKMLEQQGMGGSYTAEELDRIRYMMQEFRKLDNALQSDFYVEMPNPQAPHSAGRLKEEVVQSGMDALNLARYIAKLPNDIVDDDLYRSYAQAGAVLLDSLGYLDHEPGQPSNMTSAFYYLAYNGTSRSNLIQGFAEEDLVDAVWAYMDDSDASNIDVVGHRRWILSPKMAKASVGISGNFSTLYIFDESRKGNIEVDFTPWPGNLFPISQVRKDLAWSVSLDESYLANTNNIKVKMTRLRDNKSWVIDPTINAPGGGFFNVSEENFGNMPAIVFRLQYEHEEALYMKNDVFLVEVEGLTKPLSYTVKLFSLKDAAKLQYTKAR